MERIKRNKLKLLIGLFIIPIMYILLTTVMGMLIAIIKDHDFTFNLLQYWKNIYQNAIYCLVALFLSVVMYFYYGYKICFAKSHEPTLKSTKQTNFGQAQWLTEKELNTNYPLVNYRQNHDHHGFVVNSKETKKDLLFNVCSNTHNLIIGGTGSGKSQNLVLPTIAVNATSNLKPSMIITDPKGELYQYQKTILEQSGYNVLVINLRTVTESMTWNPLQIIYDQFQTMLLTTDSQEKLNLRVLLQSDIQDLTKTLFSNDNQTEPFWNASGALITEAIILAMLEDVELAIEKASELNAQKIKALLVDILPPTKFNLASVAIIATLGKDLVAWFKNRKDTSIAKVTANQLLHGSSNALANVLMTVATNLAIFKNEFICNLTCKNDLKFDEFIKHPTALFIIVPEENRNYYVFISLLITQIYKYLTTEASKNYDGKLIRPIYFLCDEFGNIPPIPNIENMITIARSRNIFFQLILQDLKQLEHKCSKGVADIIFANCSLHTFLQTMNLATAKYYSEVIGETTVLQVSISGKGKSKNQSENLKGHPLISASEAMKLSKNQAIIFYAKENPAKTSFIPWYQNHELLAVNVELKSLSLINFEQDYYYDIKKKAVAKCPILKSAQNKQKIDSKTK